MFAFQQRPRVVLQSLEDFRERVMYLVGQVKVSLHIFYDDENMHYFLTSNIEHSGIYIETIEYKG